MNLREVREAAEYVQGIIAGWEHHPDLASEPREIIDGWRSKLLMQSTHILATIDPSPDEPITADWLREVWGGRKPTPLEQYDHSSSSTEEQVSFDSHNGVFVNFGVFWEYAVCQHCVTILTTRQQFCDLARCLGIPRKQPKPEPEGCTCLSSPNMLYAPCSYCNKQRKDGVK